ncbi:hypothetical protein F4Y59_05530 [Candidatus Poribacteria bacterium]|nr:hypothetical protein [Candidatus Poribacteria bacterium]MXY27608.1 hypothetical protein [Candidatus Poribacteria bacterium]MYK18399.1 hypothetical protein [Candidatus Poribacteria bacterium]
MKRFFLWTSILILVMLIVPTYLEACPGCKNLDDPINKGFNWSILFMMAMPFTVFGLVGGTIFLHWNGYKLSVIGSGLKKSMLRIRNLLN